MAERPESKGEKRDEERNQPSDDAAQPNARELMEEQPEEIAEEAAAVGRERLDRSNLDVAITALIGGVEISLGALAAMSVVGAAKAAAPGLEFQTALALGGLAFPIGFVFVIVGRSELFTENFLIPVVSVFNRERSLSSLCWLWVLSWVCNMAAAAAMALLISVPEAVAEPIREAYRSYAEHKLSIGTPGVLASAVLAGAVMTVLTWMLLAVREPIAKIAAIFAAGYLLFAANLAHSIVGAAALFVGFADAGKSTGEVLLWLAQATVGNLVGGVGLIALFRIAQAREKSISRSGQRNGAAGSSRSSCD